jgi:BolA protein
MNMQLQIEEKLTQALNIHFLEVVNETHMHNVPADAESHFKVTIVTDDFSGKMLIARHRMVNKALEHELKQIHALALHTMSSEEYFQKSGKSPDSPQCMGGSN